MNVAAVQLSSQDSVPANLERVTHLVREAKRAGAELVALPENFAFMGGSEDDKRAVAERIPEAPLSGDAGPIAKAVATAAKTNGVWIVAGGMPETGPSHERPYNTSLLVSPEGLVVARYRKVHLFDVALPDGTELRESAATAAGDEPVAADVAMREGTPVKLGMTVCYDVRFPELYRKLTDRGVRIVTVPAAFTLTTGKDHWHVLLRARAIENQVFVIAPAQHGKHPRGRQTYGKSLVVDPWGDVLAQAAEGEGFALARLDFAAQDRVRAAIPCLQHRRLG